MTVGAGVRKVREGETTNDVYAFLTTEPNGVVGPIYPKAMSVILTPEDHDVWMRASWTERRRCSGHYRMLK